MPRFAYKALDMEGRLIDGQAEGATMDSVAKDLADRGLQVQNLSMAAPAQVPRTAESPRAHVELGPRSVFAKDIAGPLVGKVDLPHLSFFFRQLSTMLQAGVNPVQTLSTLSTQTQSPKLARIITEIGAGVQEGHPMSAVMQRYPEVFSPLVMSLVRAGEQGGFMDRILTQIADYLDQEIKLRQLLRRVTIYPKIVIGASIVILIAANAIIAAVAPNSPISLTSPLTRPATWIILGPLLVGLFLFIRVGLHNARLKQNWDQLILMLPGLGKTSKQFAMAKFGRAFGALYKAGVPVQQSFQLAADACGNEHLRAEMQPAIRELETGAGIADTFRATGAFNPIVLDMVSTGERTGNLDHMLNKMSEFYEGEAETRSIQAAIFTGVVCLLFVACYVGYVYISNLSGIGASYQQAADEAQ
ncbi:MAG: type II secretion system F family protein [Fimbriimonadaceae bacterium]|nr:type II secretion system F family protein [Fimbriimonadaceae bacterium]